MKRPSPRKRKPSSRPPRKALPKEAPAGEAVEQPQASPIPLGWMNTMDDGTHQAVQAINAARSRNLAAVTAPADSQAWLSPMGGRQNRT
jgi:hypothetical protein